MKGVNPNCLMVDSGLEPTEWEFRFHSQHYSNNSLNEKKFALGAIVKGSKTQRTENYEIAFKVGDKEFVKSFQS